ncbi:MAG: GCN5-related N-acetyltransferase [Novosphingobium sp.]|nr:GCN5-related N-acetyltransferase [Novosphingobium sp.]
MTQGHTIISATPGDAAEIAAIYAHHVLHGVATFEVEPPSAAEMARRIAHVLAGGYPWLVARDGLGEIVGYAYAGQFHPRAAYRYTCEDSIYLRHDRLGQGIGAALLAALIAATEAGGLRQMIALIVAEEGGSVPLHRRFGFAEIGRMTAVGRKHGRWLDVITMQRALGVGNTAPPSEEP